MESAMQQAPQSLRQLKGEAGFTAISLRPNPKPEHYALI